MASRLLKVLNEIESDRQFCIKALQDKDYPIGIDGSFGEIAAVVETFPYNDEYTIVDNHVPYYTNPLDDPDIYNKPVDWIDIKTVAKQMEDRQFENYNCYPVGVIELYSEDPHCVIDLGYNYNTQTDSPIQCQTSPGDGGNCYGFALSDGFEYHTYYQSKFIQHTFEDDNNIKYIYVYCSSTNPAVNFGMGVPYLHVKTNSTIQIRQISYFSIAISDFTCNPLPSYCYLLAPYTNRHKNIPDQSGYNRSLSVRGTEYTELESNLMTKFWRLAGGGGKVWVIGEKQLTQSTDQWNYIDVTNCKYIKMPYYFAKIRDMRYNGSNANFWSDPGYLKSIELTEIPEGGLEQKDIVDSTQYSIFGACHDLYTTQWDAFKTIVTDRFFRYCFSNMRVVGFPNLISITGSEVFADCGFQYLFLPKITILERALGHMPRLQTLVAPQVTTISTAVFNTPSMYRLELPNLTQITTNLFSTYDYAFTIFNAPSLTTITIASIFNYTPNLRELIVGNDFASNLNITNCRFITKESLVDLINKLKDITGSGSSLTLTLGTINRNKLTPEEIAIATDKGWTVQ